VLEKSNNVVDSTSFSLLALNYSNNHYSVHICLLVEVTAGEEL